MPDGIGQTMSGVKMFYQLLGKEISLIYYNELNLSNWTQQVLLWSRRHESNVSLL